MERIISYADKEIPWALNGAFPIGYTLKLRLLRTVLLLSCPHPLGQRLRLFTLGRLIPGGPAHGDSPLGFRPAASTTSRLRFAVTPVKGSEAPPGTPTATQGKF
jgi:hypothetical protein